MGKNGDKENRRQKAVGRKQQKNSDQSSVTSKQLTEQTRPTECSGQKNAKRQKRER